MQHLERNKNINRGYRKLEIWIESVELFAYVKKKLDDMSNLSYKVKAQIEDSALSISSNIAEGYGRRFIKENIQFNSIALGSLSENYTQIYNLFNSDIIDETWFNEYDEKHYSIENKLIKFNKSQVEILKNNREWKDDYLVKEIIEEYGETDD
jgi:four helix bundle protein